MAAGDNDHEAAGPWPPGITVSHRFRHSAGKGVGKPIRLMILSAQVVTYIVFRNTINIPEHPIMHC